MRNSIKNILDKTYMTTKGEITGSELIAKLLFKKAIQGNLKAIEIIRDTTGESPIEQVVDEIDQSVIDEVERIVLEVESE